jgi:hypothetical protein
VGWEWLAGKGIGEGGDENWRRAKLAVVVVLGRAWRVVGYGHGGYPVEMAANVATVTFFISVPAVL